MQGEYGVGIPHVESYTSVFTKQGPLQSSVDKKELAAGKKTQVISMALGVRPKESGNATTEYIYNHPNSLHRFSKKMYGEVSKLSNTSDIKATEISNSLYTPNIVMSAKGVSLVPVTPIQIESDEYTFNKDQAAAAVAAAAEHKKQIEIKD